MFCLSLYLLNCTFAATDETPVKQMVYRTPVGTPVRMQAAVSTSVGQTTYRTPVGTPSRQLQEQTVLAPTYSGVLGEVLVKFLNDSEIPGCFEENSQSISGLNYLKTGIIKYSLADEDQKLFVIQRRKEDYPGGKVPVVPCDLNSVSFIEALGEANRVVKKCGVVPPF